MCLGIWGLFVDVRCSGGDDPCDGDGAEEEEANEGEFLHPSTRDFHHESCSMIKKMINMNVNLVA